MSGLYLGNICCSFLFLSFEENKTNFSHTEFHLSAIQQYSSTTITELVSTEKKLPKHWYTSLNFRQEFTKGWDGGKTVTLSSKKRKTESCDWAWNWHPSRSPIQYEKLHFLPLPQAQSREKHIFQFKPHASSINYFFWKAPLELCWYVYLPLQSRHAC